MFFLVRNVVCLFKAPPKSGENAFIHPQMRTCINVISTFQSKRECVFGNKTLAFLGWPPKKSLLLLIWRWFTFFQLSWTDPKSTRCYNPLKWSDMGALMALKNTWAKNWFFFTSIGGANPPHWKLFFFLWPSKSLICCHDMTLYFLCCIA